MLAKLEEVERLGIVKREISSVQDQPTRVWRAQTASTPRLKGLGHLSKLRLLNGRNEKTTDR
jgi:hypothetical protein